MTYSARIIYQVLNEELSYDKVYMAHVKERLEAIENKSDALLYLFNLEQKYLKRYAEIIGVTYVELQIFMKVLLKT